jgi:AbrB family looped-hinge helix DNA binding protein
MNKKTAPRCALAQQHLVAGQLVRYTPDMITTVDESNQVSIPPEIAHEFRISPGTRLEWTKDENGIIQVKPLPSRGELARQLLGAGRDLLKPGSDPSGDLISERQKDASIERAELP